MKDRMLERLFLRFRERQDGRALGAVFRIASPELHAVARHLVRTREEAEDLVQVTFLRAIERAEAFDPQYGLRGWLYGILWREAAKLRRTASRRRGENELPERASADTAELVAEHELPELVREALLRVPAKYREVVEPVVLDGKAPREVAALLGRAPGTIRVQLQRGLARLRRALPRDVSAWGLLGLPALRPGAGWLERASTARAELFGRLSAYGFALKVGALGLPAIALASTAALGGTALLVLPHAASPSSSVSSSSPVSPSLALASSPAGAPAPVATSHAPKFTSSSMKESVVMKIHTLALLPLVLGLNGDATDLVAADAQEREAVPRAAAIDIDAKIAQLDALVTELLGVATEKPESEEGLRAWDGLMAALGKVEPEYRRRRQLARSAKVKPDPWTEKTRGWIRDVSQIRDAGLRAQALTEIGQALAPGDAARQAAACRALASLGDVKFEKAPFRTPLLAFARTASAEHRVNALYAIYNTERRPEDLELALELLSDPEVEPAKVSHLLFLFGDGDLTGRAGALVESRLVTDDPSKLRQAMGGLWGARVSGVIEARLIELSRSPNGELAHDAIYFGLSTLDRKSPAVIERLVEVLSDVDPNNHERAIWGLGHGVPAEHAPLVAAAAREFFDVRGFHLQRKAVQLVGQYGTSSDVDWLQGIANDERHPDRLRKLAARAAERASNH